VDVAVTAPVFQPWFSGQQHMAMNGRSAS
jgi:hypothetical protein